jgi:hypothetical protein
MSKKIAAIDPAYRNLGLSIENDFNMKVRLSQVDLTKYTKSSKKPKSILKITKQELRELVFHFVEHYIHLGLFTVDHEYCIEEQSISKKKIKYIQLCLEEILRSKGFTVWIIDPRKFRKYFDISVSGGKEKYKERKALSMTTDVVDEQTKKLIKSHFSKLGHGKSKKVKMSDPGPEDTIEASHMLVYFKKNRKEVVEDKVIKKKFSLYTVDYDKVSQPILEDIQLYSV